MKTKQPRIAIAMMFFIAGSESDEATIRLSFITESLDGLVSRDKMGACISRAIECDLDQQMCFVRQRSRKRRVDEQQYCLVTM